MPLHVSSTYAHHQEVKIALHSIWYHHITQQRSLPPAGFEPTISASERLQTYALDRAATWTGNAELYCSNYKRQLFFFCCGACTELNDR